jgi:hypothetical protein
MLQARNLQILSPEGRTMTASANGKAKSDTGSTFVADTVKSTSEQMFVAVKQTTTLTMDAASALLESLGKFMPSMPSVPGSAFLPSRSSIVQLIDVGFDTTENLLSMQRGFAIQAVERFVPASGAR